MMKLVFGNFEGLNKTLLQYVMKRYFLKFLKLNFLLVFALFSSFISYAQISKQNNTLPIEEQRPIMIFNLIEHVRWSNINKIEKLKIGVLGTDVIKNSLLKISNERRIFDKLIGVKKISTLEAVKNCNVVYVSTAYEYLLKSILESTKGKQILVITEGFPTNSSMINMVKAGDTYSYDINRMFLREANLKINSTLASYAVTSNELKEKLYKKAEQKLYVVSRENDEQKKVIKNQIEDLNKKEKALIEKDNSIKNLFVETELKNKTILEKIALGRVNEERIKNQINQLSFQQERIDSINNQINNQIVILEEQSNNIKNKNKILAEKNIIIDTQRKHNIMLTILSTMLLILSLSLLVAYVRNKKLNIRLNAQHIEIKAQSKLLSSKNNELEQFAYITSHDLQEPLNTISSLIDIIKIEFEDKFNSEGKEMLGFIKEGSVRMKKLIDGLLQYSRLGRDKELKNVNCVPLLDLLKEDLQSTINNTGAEINYDNLPTITANELELKLLFQNLISNSIKFRDSNIKPKIDISCEKGSDNDDVTSEKKFWIFSITDNGIGIPKEYQDRVFNIFQRLHSRSDYEGSGIGLAHCKKIVEAHSGKIWFTSENGLGTTFYFSIPA